MSELNQTVLFRDLRDDEGERLHVYDDDTGKSIDKGSTLTGFPTIGIGRNVAGRGITMAESKYLYTNNATEIEAFLRTFSWWGGLSQARKLAIANLVFNLGESKWRTYTQTQALIAAGDFEELARRMQNEWAWPNQIQRSRSERVIYSIRTGERP